MNILIFDTETTSLNKPFCYNVGWIIVDSETGETQVARDYVIEQIWHNLELFATAYYADKRPLYVARMRARSVIMDKWGYVCQQMARDIKSFGVEHCYAYNSGFDVKVFDWNCDWFKTQNPLETVMVHDILGYVHKHIAFLPEYQAKCEELAMFTENDNYSTRAESVYRYMAQDNEFEEEHTALSDSKIECQILLKCAHTFGQDITKDETVYKCIPRNAPREFWVVTQDGIGHAFDYKKKFKLKNREGFALKW